MNTSDGEGGAGRMNRPLCSSLSGPSVGLRMDRPTSGDQALSPRQFLNTMRTFLVPKSRPSPSMARDASSSPKKRRCRRCPGNPALTMCHHSKKARKIARTVPENNSVPVIPPSPSGSTNPFLAIPLEIPSVILVCSNGFSPKS